MVRDIYSSHTTVAALLLTNKSLCPPAFVTDQMHKASARRCLALLNVKCFVPLFVGRKFIPDYLLSLTLASITAEPTLFSIHRFYFLFLFFLFLSPAACPHHKTTTRSVIRTVIFCQWRSLCSEEEMSYATGPEKSPLAAVAEATAGRSKTQ